MSYKQCKRCLMDNLSDDTIVFDNNMYCNYCNDAIDKNKREYFPNEMGKEKLNGLFREIKSKSIDKKYDCIMGISGGLDSSYLLYLGYINNLKVLCVHIDDGYDTNISKKNIEKLIEKTGYDLEIIKPDERQYNDLTLSFMKAGVPNIAIPQDNILFAYLYKKAKEYKINYFLSGYNCSLESILQRGNTHNPYDVVNIKDISKKYGNEKIDKLKFISTIKLRLYKKLYRINTVYPLNYVKYERDSAFKELKKFCGYEYYGRKHLENILTAFIQLYWFPKKFNVDKRKSHLSSMIISNQISRELALKELNEPLYDEKQMNNYVNIIKEKMKISDFEFEQIMGAETHQHSFYKTEDKSISYRLFMLMKRIKNDI